MEQTCGNCRFFLLQNKNVGAGICRRYPPFVLAGRWIIEETKRPIQQAGIVPMGTSVGQVENIAGQNPPTTRDLWCGEHQEAYVKAEAN